MALNPPSRLQQIDLDPADKARIEAFMQGTVYSWMKTEDTKPFAVRDLMGGANFEWCGTPLEVLYQRHIDAGKSNNDAIAAAGRDLGWIVKSVLHHDKRTFIQTKTFNPSKGCDVNQYHWVGGEP